MLRRTFGEVPGYDRDCETFRLNHFCEHPICSDHRVYSRRVFAQWTGGRNLEACAREPQSPQSLALAPVWRNHPATLATGSIAGSGPSRRAITFPPLPHSFQKPTQTQIHHRGVDPTSSACRWDSDAAGSPSPQRNAQGSHIFPQPRSASVFPTYLRAAGRLPPWIDNEQQAPSRPHADRLS
jgi:hypothetical protein